MRLFVTYAPAERAHCAGMPHFKTIYPRYFFDEKRRREIWRSICHHKSDAVAASPVFRYILKDDSRGWEEDGVFPKFQGSLKLLTV